MFALNMFDGPIDCRAETITRRPGYEPSVRSLRPAYLQRRLACDPIIYFEAAKNMFRALSETTATDFELVLKSTLAPSNNMMTIIDIGGFCVPAVELLGLIWGFGPRFERFRRLARMPFS